MKYFGSLDSIELLVSFFKNAQIALAPRGSIIVTLFEGSPYTLWNIRDLGRHSGLQVEKSFKFQAKAYPCYRHARTLGVVKGKDGKEGGGWKGEERDSRSYVFMRKGEVAEAISTNLDKRKRGDESDDDDEEEFPTGAWEDNSTSGSEPDQDDDTNEDDEEVWDGIDDLEDDPNSPKSHDEADLF